MQWKIEVKPATKRDQKVVQELARFYVYDMYRFCGFRKGWETPKNGLYTCDDLSPYWKQKERYPFVIKVNGELAGFVLINKVGTSKTVDWNMGEFFVVSKFQGKGVGKQVAFQIFNAFPGTWEVNQIPDNIAAIQFWEKVIFDYTHGDYQKELKTVKHSRNSPMFVIKFDAVS